MDYIMIEAETELREWKNYHSNALEFKWKAILIREEEVEMSIEPES